MAELLTDSGRLKRLRLRGNDLRAEIGRSVIGAPVLDLSLSAISQLSFVVADPGFELLDSGIITQRTRVDYGDLDFEVAALGTGGHTEETLELTCRARGPQKMRRADGALMFRDISPTAFMERRAKAHGLKFVGEPSPKRAQVGRVDPKDQPSENDWTAGLRLASELGFILFESTGTLYFGRPRWLVKRSRDFTVRYPRAKDRSDKVPIGIPVCRRSTDAGSFRLATVDLELPWELADDVRPGRVLELRGMPTFREDYIVTTVNTTLDADSPVSVSATTPIDPKPEKPDPQVDLDGDGVVDTTGAAVTNPGTGGGTSSAGFAWPASGEVISAFKTAARPDHYGIDIAAPDGARISAAKAGTVSVNGYDSDGYGHWLEIDHGGGYATRYAHFPKASIHRVGARLEKGQVLGYVDSSGNATGPHLHFEVRRSGSPIDPVSVLP